MSMQWVPVTRLQSDFASIADVAHTGTVFIVTHHRRHRAMLVRIHDRFIRMVAIQGREINSVPTREARARIYELVRDAHRQPVRILRPKGQRDLLLL